MGLGPMQLPAGDTNITTPRLALGVIIGTELYGAAVAAPGERSQQDKAVP
jgi:hypothetical protein